MPVAAMLSVSSTAADEHMNELTDNLLISDVPFMAVAN